jgi:hypothetical protein
VEDLRSGCCILKPSIRDGLKPGELEKIGMEGTRDILEVADDINAIDAILRDAGDVGEDTNDTDVAEGEA